MFLAGDEFGNTQFGNNNGYCQDNEISWLDWKLLEKNRDLFEFFKFVVHFRKKHPVIRRKLPDATGKMRDLHTYDRNGNLTDPENNVHTVCIGFAGYDAEKCKDDVVYMCVNTYWEDVPIRLPGLSGHSCWYLCINTFGDGKGRYFFREGEEVRIEDEFIMRPRSVAVFYAR